MAEGIDVYTKYQQITDFGALAKTRQFVYVKVTDGTTVRDTANYGPRGRSAGLKMGAYHYAQPGDPTTQANLFITSANGAGLLDLAPALDIEAPFVPGTSAATFAITFLKRVKALGHRPCLYGNNAMLSAILPAVKAAVPDVIVWAARYGADPTIAFDVHQYSDAGTVSGVRGKVDTNRGVIPLNTPQTSGGTVPAVDQEDDNMDSVMGAGTGATDPWVELHCPINGGRYLRIASTYGNDAVVDGISMIDDTPGGQGSNGRTIQQGGIVAADRPGPWDLAGADPNCANYSHVVVRLKAPKGAKISAWVNGRG